MSWLKKVGVFLGKLVGIVAKAEPTAVSIAEALLPEYSALIAGGNVIFQTILKEIVAAEAALGAGTGPQKLAAVIAAVGPAIDGWIAASFPGTKQVSEAVKTGLVNAVVAVLNEIQEDVTAVG